MDVDDTAAGDSHMGRSSMNIYPRKKIHEKSLKHDASYSVIANVSDDQDQEEEDVDVKDLDSESQRAPDGCSRVAGRMLQYWHWL